MDRVDLKPKLLRRDVHKRMAFFHLFMTSAFYTMSKFKIHIFLAAATAAVVVRLPTVVTAATPHPTGVPIATSY